MTHCLLVEVKTEDAPGKVGRPRGGGKKRTWPTPNVRQTRARSRKDTDLVAVVPDVAREMFTTLLPEGAVCVGTITLAVSTADEQQVPMEATE